MRTELCRTTTTNMRKAYEGPPNRYMTFIVTSLLEPGEVSRESFHNFKEFPSTENLGVADLYKAIYPSISGDRSNESYFSAPLSSAGAMAVIKSLDDAVTKTRVIELNGMFARAFAGAVADEIGYSGTMVLPSFLSQRAREGWTELDFNTFWMFYISGISPDNAKEYDGLLHAEANPSQVDFTVFNHGASKDAKRTEYKKLINHFLGWLKENKVDINPLNQLFFSLDFEESLGCSIEYMLAQAFKIQRTILNCIDLTVDEIDPSRGETPDDLYRRSIRAIMSQWVSLNRYGSEKFEGLFIK